MRYVIVSVVKGDAGNFNNNLWKEVFEKFHAKSSKLPAHFTIKAPFECDLIDEVDNVIESFCNNHNKAKYTLEDYGHFDNRVVYMKVHMSEEGKILHNNLIDELEKIDFINFQSYDGKNKVFHVTISSKKIKKIYDELWDYVNKIPFKFNCFFDNICIYKWEDNTWKLHKEFNLK